MTSTYDYHERRNDVPNERYVKISMRDRWDRIPYDANGDPDFKELFLSPTEALAVSDVFTNEEIVHLVNKALYVMKYQRETHANRNAAKKARKEIEVDYKNLE